MESNVKRIAIFGSGGQLGVELKSEFQLRGYEVAGFERTHVDITDPARVIFGGLFLRLPWKNRPFRGVEEPFAAPLSARPLARRTADLVERGATGIFHAGGGTPISWFEWAMKIFEAAGVKPAIKPTNEREFRTAARRPKYSALANLKLEAFGIDPMPTLDQAIRSYLDLRGSPAAR